MSGVNFVSKRLCLGCMHTSLLTNLSCTACGELFVCEGTDREIRDANLRFEEMNRAEEKDE